MQSKDIFWEWFFGFLKELITFSIKSKDKDFYPLQKKQHQFLTLWMLIDCLFWGHGSNLFLVFIVFLVSQIHNKDQHWPLLYPPFWPFRVSDKNHKFYPSWHTGTSMLFSENTSWRGVFEDFYFQDIKIHFFMQIFLIPAVLRQFHYMHRYYKPETNTFN